MRSKIWGAIKLSIIINLVWFTLVGTCKLGMDYEDKLREDKANADFVRSVELMKFQDSIDEQRADAALGRDAQRADWVYAILRSNLDALLEELDQILTEPGKKLQRLERR